MEALGVVTVVKSIVKDEVEQEFPDLFKVHGRLNDNTQVKLEEGVQRFTLTTLRRFAMPLLSKMKAELQ